MSFLLGAYHVSVHALSLHYYVQYKYWRLGRDRHDGVNRRYPAIRRLVGITTSKLPRGATHDKTKPDEDS